MSDVFDQAIDRVLSRKNREVYELLQRSGLYDNVATAIRGRKVLVRGKWLTDFASCNYLGLDLRPEVMEAIGPAVREWGTHPSWARMCCSPELYERLEAALAALVGTEDALVLPTISLIGIGLIPALTGKGAAIFADKVVHKVNHDGCRLARDMGATLTSFHHGDLSTLEVGLAAHAGATVRLVVVDGVLSTTGRLPELGRILEIARAHDAIVYVDDAHGFGVLGESPSPEHPYGRKGNGVIRHLGLGYDNVLYVSGLSKAYSSLAAFIGCPKKLKPFLKCNVTSYLVSGPVPTASLATALAGLELNAREGDTWRRTLYEYTRAILDAYRERGIPTDNDTAFPIVSAYVGSAENVERGGQLLFEEGINVTLQGYPLVPRDKGVLRATPTVANTWDEVEQLITAVGRVHQTLTAR
ncbi:pyridoxal phosphate-dependent aminotransferase family protein [Archangium gephyra]|uniref:aminotransferase class I/II-fold pyridoxal phosphate-dependent enzyme n=1 Tax=Archangium gephyra TaxID=48 RepID=UPI0035D514CA